MQNQSINISQVLLTIVGLILFVAVLALNHTHPRNYGVANLGSSNSSAVSKL